MHKNVAYHSRNNTQNITIPILVTIHIVSGVSDENLRQSVEEAVLKFGFALQISDNRGVVVFGKSVKQANKLLVKYILHLSDRCRAENTLLPSPDGDQSLDITLSWPETILGETYQLTCPCNLTLSSSVLSATRTCGGDFVSGAEWNLPMDSSCDFTLVARRLCRLANVCAVYHYYY